MSAQPHIPYKNAVAATPNGKLLFADGSYADPPANAKRNANTGNITLANGVVIKSQQQNAAAAANKAAKEAGATDAQAMAAANKAGNEVLKRNSPMAGRAAAEEIVRNGGNSEQANAVKKAVDRTLQNKTLANGAGGHSGGIKSFASPAMKQGRDPALFMNGVPGNIITAAGNKLKAPAIADALIDPQARPADGRLGAYVPANQYLHGATLESTTLAQNLQTRPKLAAACADSDKGCVLFRGPADAAPAKPVASLFPLGIEAGEGMDDVLIDSPPSYLWADSLMGADTVSLTTTKNSSRDLRGEPPIDPIYSLDAFGTAQPGFDGTYQSSLGPYGLKKAVREYTA